MLQAEIKSQNVLKMFRLEHSYAACRPDIKSQNVLKMFRLEHSYATC
jgi:hypothetical protein